jgi:hypothetical protein
MEEKGSCIETTQTRDGRDRMYCILPSRPGFAFVVGKSKSCFLHCRPSNFIVLQVRCRFVDFFGDSEGGKVEVKK